MSAAVWDQARGFGKEKKRLEEEKIGKGKGKMAEEEGNMPSELNDPPREPEPTEAGPLVMAKRVSELRQKALDAQEARQEAVERAVQEQEEEKDEEKEKEKEKETPAGSGAGKPEAGKPEAPGVKDDDEDSEDSVLLTCCSSSSRKSPLYPNAFKYFLILSLDNAFVPKSAGLSTPLIAFTSTFFIFCIHSNDTSKCLAFPSPFLEINCLDELESMYNLTSGSIPVIRSINFCRKIPSLIMLTAAIVSLSQLDSDTLLCRFDWKCTMFPFTKIAPQDTLCLVSRSAAQSESEHISTKLF